MPDTDKIIEKVNLSIEELEKIFKKQPEHFYTENDLVCTLHQIIKVQLAEDLIYRGHTLLHCEYPTPWKCNMKNYEFTYEEDDARKKRGHFDISILAPSFIDRCEADYQRIKGQKFSRFIVDRNAHIAEQKDIMLYAIELMFSRDPRARNCFTKSTMQDAKKLRATRDEKKALKTSKLLCFSYGKIFESEKWDEARKDDIISLIYT